MAGMLGIGVSGLLAYQRSLQTVSHNVANANTEGYSRQRVELGTQLPLFQGGSYSGTGVRVQSVERIYDDFMISQVRTYSSSSSYANVYEENASLIDGMLADPAIGMGPAISEFFSELQAVANDPSAIPPRQSMLTQAETTVDRFAYINQRMEDIRGQLNQQMSGVVGEINSFATAIAALNKDITLSPGQNPPNDLLDQRDTLLNNLAEKVAITTVEQDNGAVNVFFGKGQLLVVNFDASELRVDRNEFDVRQLNVSLNTGGGNWDDISSQISGGHIGALIDYRENVLNEAQNSLGALAIGFADSFNEQHLLGQDLNGNLGVNFFNVSSLEVLSSNNNDISAGFNADVDATLTDRSKLSGDEYMLRYSAAAGYSLTRQSDGFTEVIGFAPLNYDPSSDVPSAAFEDYGFSLSLASGTVQDGDSFLIRPGRRGAQDLSVNITNSAEIAAAAPVRTSADIFNNTGSAEISPGEIKNTGFLPWAANLDLTYSSGTSSFVVSLGATTVSYIDASGAETVLASPGNPIPYPTAKSIIVDGVEVKINGLPDNGDKFSIEANTNGVGDNRNALLLSELQNQRLLNDGTASYMDFYGGVVADVGILTRQAQLTSTAQGNLLEQAQNSRDALSGVNLDEEAANLVKFQQAYQAASQVIVTANTMFQSLIAALRG